jgi:hypothetical protein
MLTHVVFFLLGLGAQQHAALDEFSAVMLVLVLPMTIV